MKTSTKAGVLALGLVLLSSIIAPQQAKAWDFIDDFVQPNFNAIRGGTVGRLFNQTFVAYLDAQTLESIKDQQGGDYETYLTDWCNNAVASSEYTHIVTMPYISSTWRFENGGVNCYSRNNNY
jgi:hypothetical protein